MGKSFDFGDIDWSQYGLENPNAGPTPIAPAVPLPDWAAPDYVPQARAPVVQQAPSAAAPPVTRKSGGNEHIKALVESMANTPHSQQSEVSRALRAAPATTGEE